MGEPTRWDAVNPVGLFRYRPADFPRFAPSIDAGTFGPTGLLSLLALPAAGTWGCWRLWPTAGAWALLALVPAVAVGAWLAAADVAFRRRSPTRTERAWFDHAIVNWFGLFACLTIWPAALLAGVGAVVWWLVA